MARDASCHIDSFRLLSVQDAGKFSCATEEVKDFYENLTAIKTCAEQSGGDSDVENAAVGGVTGTLKTSLPLASPIAVPKGDVNAANQAWKIALGKSPPPALGVEQGQKHLEKELALKLAAAN